jgi:DNA-directed RNA polymerase subunit RPC12/RpoP
MLESNLYPCAYCRKDVEVLGDGWDSTGDTVICPHCAEKMSLEWDENGHGNGWFYFEKEE